MSPRRAGNKAWLGHEKSRRPAVPQGPTPEKGGAPFLTFSEMMKVAGCFAQSHSWSGARAVPWRRGTKGSLFQPERCRPCMHVFVHGAGPYGPHSAVLPRCPQQLPPSRPRPTMRSLLSSSLSPPLSGASTAAAAALCLLLLDGRRTASPSPSDAASSVASVRAAGDRWWMVGGRREIVGIGGGTPKHGGASQPPAGLPARLPPAARTLFLGSFPSLAGAGFPEGAGSPAAATRS